MKVKSSVKRICGFCYIVRRGKTVYVRCQKYKRHKQRQGFHTVNASFKIGDKNYCECNFESEKKDLNDIVDIFKNKML
jgi:ribosomal protein L36